MLELVGATSSYVHGGTEQMFCERCRTRICNGNDAVPGMVVLRAGTLAASDRLTPMAHIWVKRKQPWVLILDGVPRWEGTPCQKAFAAALRDAAT